MPGTTAFATHGPSGSCVCFHLRRTARAVTQAYERALAPTGLVPTQFSLLTVLHRFGPVPLSVLADRMGMDRTTLTRNLKPLERDGLVTSQAGNRTDRRVRLIQITVAGERTWKKGEPLWAAVHAHMLQGLGPDGWPLLRNSLTRAVAVAGERPAD